MSVQNHIFGEILTDNKRDGNDLLKEKPHEIFMDIFSRHPFNTKLSLFRVEKYCPT